MTCLCEKHKDSYIQINTQENFLSTLGIRELQDSFYRRWMPETHQAIRDLKVNTSDGGFANLRYFYDKLLEVEASKRTYARLYAESVSEFERQIILETLTAIVKEEKQVKNNLAAIFEVKPPVKNKNNGNNDLPVTPDMIAQALDYPLTAILGENSKGGMALCIAHNERNPSMNIRRNFAYCHSCGFSGDAITVAEKVWGLSFVEAVKKLCLL